ncbi:MAG: NUDIX domain-containing protein [Chloroflexota bacterium]|uniref:Nudix hydrolase domain-containing protein n=1 Tax=marine metagenome TaxID=408172 RepID=A0A382A7F9_9ZZZZ|nr:NUDIX domain-containing protein [Chloroflexota bacterium]
MKFIEHGFVDCTGQALTRVPDIVRASASGVVFDLSGRVLLQQRSDNGWWGLPGGGMEPGESLFDCSAREMLEETGLTVEVKCIVKVYSDLKDFTAIVYPDGNLVQYVAALFICSKIAGELRISDESLDIGYYFPKELPESTLLSTKLRIDDAIEHVRDHSCVEGLGLR